MFVSDSKQDVVRDFQPEVLEINIEQTSISSHHHLHL